METSALAMSRLICRVAALQDDANAAKAQNAAMSKEVDDLKQARLACCNKLFVAVAEL